MGRNHGGDPGTSYRVEHRAWRAVAEATVYKLAQAGDIPAVKVGRAWRFKKNMLDEWFREQARLSASSRAG